MESESEHDTIPINGKAVKIAAAAGPTRGLPIGVYQFGATATLGVASGRITAVIAGAELPNVRKQLEGRGLRLHVLQAGEQSIVAVERKETLQALRDMGYIQSLPGVLSVTPEILMQKAGR